MRTYAAASPPSARSYSLIPNLEDNEIIPIVQSGLVNQSQLTKIVDQSIRKLGKEAVRVNFNIGEDTGGDPSIFFRIVLTDSASAEATLWDVTNRIEAKLNQEIHPLENWGLIPYYSYRSKSEQAKRNDPEWL